MSILWPCSVKVKCPHAYCFVCELLAVLFGGWCFRLRICTSPCLQGHPAPDSLYNAVHRVTQADHLKEEKRLPHCSQSNLSRLPAFRDTTLLLLLHVCVHKCACKHFDFAYKEELQLRVHVPETFLRDLCLQGVVQSVCANCGTHQRPVSI